MITITESAREYLAELLSKQADAQGVRVFINQPGTPRAETCIAYCREGDIEEGDVEEDFGQFRAWFQGRSLPFLEDAMVDYNKDKFGGQLTIKAPNAKMPRVDADSPVEDRINYVLYNEVNPSLAAHGGEVSLVEVTDDAFAILQLRVCPAEGLRRRADALAVLQLRVCPAKGLRRRADARGPIPRGVLAAH